MKRFAVSSVVLTALVAVSALTACTASTPSPAGSTGPAGSPTKTSTPGTDVSTPAPIEAVLVVASVDVDGAHLSASGYIQGAVEDGGTCVFTFSGNGSEFTMEHDASADRMTTSCGTVQVPIDKFTRGPWAVTVGMAVKGTTYTSPPTTVEVP